MEAKFSRQVKRKCLHACEHGVRLLVMLLFALLIFMWVVPPQSFFGDAAPSLGLRFGRAFYDTTIAGQVLIILVFSTVLWPMRRMLHALYALYVIFKKRFFYRRRILKMPFGNPTDTPVDNCF